MTDIETTLRYAYVDKETALRYAYADEETALRYAIEEAFSGDFTSLKEHVGLIGTMLFEPTSLEELMAIRKDLLQQFADEVFKRRVL